MIIKCQNLYYKVPHGKVIYENLNFHLFKGDFVAVLGKNGAGKTTLIDILMGLRSHTSGEVHVLGERPMSSHRERKNKIFVLSHDIQIQQSHSVRNYLDFTSYFYPYYDKSREQYLKAYFQIEENEKFGSLSTGQKVKAQIVAALSSGVELILIDEVTAVLDPLSRKMFFDLLEQVKKEGQTSLLMATNIIDDLSRAIDKVLFIDASQSKLISADECFQYYQKSTDAQSEIDDSGQSQRINQDHDQENKIA